MPTQSNSGSQVCTVATEHTLATVTTAGTYELILDMDPSVNGTTPDIFEIRYKIKVLTGSTSKQVHRKVVRGDRGAEDVVIRLPPIPIVHELIVTLKQTQGTSRTIDWSLVRVDN